MKSDEDIQISSENDCIFCDEEEDTSNLFEMMNQALFAKHSNQNNNQYLNPIDIILKLEEPITPPEFAEHAKYKEFVFLDQDQENLKRSYASTEFDGKIKMLSEYYKFHKDIPRVIETSIEKILGKYYDRKRQFDYKCIKRLLKEEQGLSITSVQESLSENSEEIELKSKYSTLLNALNQAQEKKVNSAEKMSDSNLLEDICKEIGKALPKIKVADTDFKGYFFKNDKNFEDYVNKQKGKNTKEPIFSKKSHQKVQIPKNYFGFQKETVKDNTESTAKFKREGRFHPKPNQKLDENKKRFVYNTNIKIEIQNAMFYPDSGNFQNYEIPDQQKSNMKVKPKKTLIGKISSFNNDAKYRTPVSKIYQPQEAEVSRYRKRRNPSNSKERIRTKQRESREHLPEKQEPRKIISSNSVRKMSIDRQRLVNQGTISVGRLKVENRRPELAARATTGPTRSGSTQSIRRRSVTLSQNNRQGSVQRIPIAKYSSSQMKDGKKLKGINIKELLTKKLNIYER